MSTCISHAPPSMFREEKADIVRMRLLTFLTNDAVGAHSLIRGLDDAAYLLCCRVKDRRGGGRRAGIH